MPKPTGGPAFPLHPGADPRINPIGMSLRDHYAGKALEGWLSNSAVQVHGQPLNTTVEHADLIAEASFIYADAMLRARNKP